MGGGPGQTATAAISTRPKGREGVFLMKRWEKRKKEGGEGREGGGCVSTCRRASLSLPSKNHALARKEPAHTPSDSPCQADESEAGGAQTSPRFAVSHPQKIAAVSVRRGKLAAGHDEKLSPAIQSSLALSSSHFLWCPLWAHWPKRTHKKRVFLAFLVLRLPDLVV